VTDRDLADVLRCPKCGAESDLDASNSQISLGYRTFSTERSRVSVTEGCGPGAVDQVREAMGPDLAGCVRSDGRMVFQDSKQREAWDKRKGQIAARHQHQEEDAGRVKPKPEPVSKRERDATMRKIAELAKAIPG